MEIAKLSGFVGGVPERSKGADCKSAGSAFEGSNPSPSTRSGRPRGCSSMVEQKPSKLTTRVRFPSPAPARGHYTRGKKRKASIRVSGEVRGESRGAVYMRGTQAKGFDEQRSMAPEDEALLPM